MKPGTPKKSDPHGAATPLFSYGRWAHGILWEPKISLSIEMYGRQYPEIKNFPTSTVYLDKLTVKHVQNVGREPDAATYSDDQKVVKIKDPNFNKHPTKYGKIDDSWLVLQRCNPLFRENITKAWVEMVFDCRQVVVDYTNEDYIYTGPGDSPKKWSDLALANNPKYIPPDVIGNPYITLYNAPFLGGDIGVVVAQKFSLRKVFVCEMRLGSSGQNSYFNPQTKTVYPLVGFDGPMGTIGSTTGFVPDDKHPYGFKVKSKLLVDRTVFPAGMDKTYLLPRFGPTKGAENFLAYIKCEVKWSEKKPRPL